LVKRLVEQSIAELSGKIASGEVSAVEVVSKTIEQIKKLNKTINAFITVLERQAVEDAERLDKELRLGGRPRSMLHGIPVALKDIIYVRGVRCTAGSRILNSYVAEYDATVVKKLREAGAVIVGTNNLHEFASGVTGVNPHYGAVRNPWDTERIAGGSSSGSAAAVAACMVFASVGTDTSGSIRIPSALCGVVGFKPSYGRVSKFGVIPLSWSLDHVGPITRTVRDAAIMLKAMAGFDYSDDASVFVDVLDYPNMLERDMKNYRICYLRDILPHEPPSYIRKMLDRVFEKLNSIGVEVAEMGFKYSAEQIRGCWAPIRLGEAAAFHDEWYRTRPGDYGDDVRKMLERGRGFSVIDYVKAQRLRIEIRNELLKILDAYHAVVTPTTLIPAPKVGEEKISLDGEVIDIYTALTTATILFNITGVPAITIPAGLSGEKLPLGLQIASRPFDELTLLRLAYSLEREMGFSQRPLVS